MKIAIPVVNGQVSAHFGHCETYALIEANMETKTLRDTVHLVPPPHQPGVLPLWLHQQGATVIIAGGMGQRAVSLFHQNGIETVLGIAEGRPEDVARQYVEGTLKAGESLCDH